MKDNTKIVRFSVTIEDELMKAFDRFMKRRYYTNRSEAVRDLIRKELVEEEWSEEGREVAGGIAIVYDHTRRELVKKLMEIQHNFHHIIVSSQHIHIDHKNCLEIVVIKGEVGSAEELKNRLSSIKGVKHCALAKTTTGKRLS